MPVLIIIKLAFNFALIPFLLGLNLVKESDRREL